MGNSWHKVPHNEEEDCSDKKQIIDIDMGNSCHNEEEDGSDRIAIPKNFTLSELKSATKNFHPNAVLWEGWTYVDTIYIGWVNGVTYKPSKTTGVGISVAIKKFDAYSPLDFSEWQAEVNFLGKLSHPNVVKLVGYCKEDEDHFLVYEYMQMDNLENLLFKNEGEPLSWSARIKIAIGAAQGLAYLQTMKKDAIYTEFQSSSILLDENLNAKLSYFGFTKCHDDSFHSQIDGYQPLEFVFTGRVNVKSGIYRFGIMLLELISGLPALYHYNKREWRDTFKHLLCRDRPPLYERELISEIIDSRLQGPLAYPIVGVKKFAELILDCTEKIQKRRPPMEEVVARLQDIGSITS